MQHHASDKQHGASGYNTVCFPVAIITGALYVAAACTSLQHPASHAAITVFDTFSDSDCKLWVSQWDLSQPPGSCSNGATLRATGSTITSCYPNGAYSIALVSVPLLANAMLANTFALLE